LSSFSADEFFDFLPALPPAPIIVKFKLALYKKYIIDQSLDATGPSATTARVQPRAVRPVPRNSSSSASLENKSAGTPSAPAITSISSKQPPPTSAAIVLLLEKDLGANARCKFELLVAYNNLPSEEKDSDWRTMLGDAGRLQHVLEKAFGVEDNGTLGATYKELLKSVLSTN
jgi:hypothetical protein